MNHYRAFDDALGIEASDGSNGSGNESDGFCEPPIVGENGLTKDDFSRLFAAFQKSKQETETADDSARKSEERVHELLQMSKSARAIIISNHKSQLKKFIASLEEYKLTMMEDDNKFEEYKKSFVKIDPELEKPLHEVALTRNVQRENISLRYKQRELEIAISALKLNLEEVAKDRDIFKNAITGETTDPVAKEVQDAEKEQKQYVEDLQAKDAQIKKLKAQLQQLQKAEEALDSNAETVEITDTEVTALQMELKGYRQKVATAESAQAKREEEESNLKAKLKRLESDLKDIENGTNEVMKSINEVCEGKVATEGTEVDKAIHTLTRERADSQKKFDAAEKEMKDRASQLSQLNAKAKEKLDLASETLKKLHAELATIKQNTAKEKLAAEEYVKEQAILKTKVKSTSKLAAKQNAQMQVLKNQTTEMKKAIAEMRTSLKAMGEGIGSMYPKFQTALQNWIVQREVNSKKLVVDYQEEMALRRHYFNLIQELKGNIRVYCRVRPMSDRDRTSPTDIGAVTYPSVGELVVHNAGRNNTSSYEFEKIFDPQIKQEQVFAEVADLIVSVLDGYNVCIFAYGQTGSGKTYTMEGPPTDRGVNTRALEAVFSGSVARLPDVEYEIKITLLEIYNESIRDLLGTTDKDLKVIKGKTGMEVQDLTMVSVTGVTEVLNWLKKGAKRRHTSQTGMNDRSSRSHLVLSVYVTGVNTITKQNIAGKLHLIDLAGSERISRSGVTGDQLKEAQAINYSLSALGNCISARANNQGHVPYRDSQLTYLLQDSLEKNSKTLMFVQISPSLNDVTESICSLNFAARVRMVELGKAEKNTGGAKKKK